MLTSSDFSGLLNERFQFLPIPATNGLRLGETTADFVLPDMVNWSSYQITKEKPVI